MALLFETTRDMCLIDGFLLQAYCLNEFGEWNFSELDLNTCLGNDNGTLYWGGANFSETAMNTSLVLDGTRIEALLMRDDIWLEDVDGIWLGDGVANENGCLVPIMRY